MCKICCTSAADLVKINAGTRKNFQLQQPGHIDREIEDIVFDFQILGMKNNGVGDVLAEFGYALLQGRQRIAWGRFDFYRAYILPRSNGGLADQKVYLHGIVGVFVVILVEIIQFMPCRL